MVLRFNYRLFSQPSLLFMGGNHFVRYKDKKNNFSINQTLYGLNLGLCSSCDQMLNIFHKRKWKWLHEINLTWEQTLKYSTDQQGHYLQKGERGWVALFSHRSKVGQVIPVHVKGVISTPESGCESSTWGQQVWQAGTRLPQQYSWCLSKCRSTLSAIKHTHTVSCVTVTHKPPNWQTQQK